MYGGIDRVDLRVDARDGRDGVAKVEELVSVLFSSKNPRRPLTLDKKPRIRKIY